jgi:DNA-binding transcriptional MerR regulator
MYLTVQEVAEQTGISAHTIRYYEKSGVLPRVRRATNGIRQFSEADIASLRFIIDYKKAGLPLEDIREIIAGIVQHGCLLAQPANDEITEQSLAERLAVLYKHRQRLTEQREHLEQMLTSANQKIACYEQLFTEQRGQKVQEKESLHL